MIEYKSKVDIVYDLLMDKIIKGSYKQDDRLVISQIAKQYNVSDIPVREAIRRLESEGYVQLNANQGAVISGLDKEALIQVFQIKGVLEGYATRVSIDYITPKDIDGLRSRNEQLKKACFEKDIKKYSQINMQFHLDIYQCVPNKELYDMICNLWRKWAITKSVFEFVPTRIESSIYQHEKIIRLIEEKKYDEVEHYVRDHKFSAGDELIKMMDK